MDGKKALNVATSLDELDDCQSTDSKESQDTKEAKMQETKNNNNNNKWTDFRKRRTNKKVPKLLHSLSFPRSFSKPLLSSQSSPNLLEGAEKSEQDSRFFGDGVDFKAKIIGIKEVDQPRGDRLAQDALHELKAFVKASNSHKQKILVNISLDGIKLKDEKGTEVLHHHPVHKISFIAQDITDPRAFGYVFGSPTLGHKFFAIKTEKAAQQLVVAMRDLFHVVFEQRKKELQNQKNNLTQQNGDTQDSNSEKSSNDDVTDANVLKTNSSVLENSQPDAAIKEPIDELFDLIHEHESEDTNGTCAAFGNEFVEMSTVDKSDAFFNDPLNFMNNFSSSLFTEPDDSPFNPNKDNAETGISNGIPNSNPADDAALKNQEFSRSLFPPDVHNHDSFNSTFTVDKYAPLANLTFDQASAPITETLEMPEFSIVTESEQAAAAAGTRSHTVSESSVVSFETSPPKPPRLVDLFSDLDPLGKDRPFVDKKDFFHEVKNPPKKVLKDLMETAQTSSCVNSCASSDSGLSGCSLHESSNSPPPVIFPIINSPTTVLSKEEKANASFPFTNPFTQLPSAGASNAFDDPFFAEDFHLPSPSIAPPPLPPATQAAVETLPAKTSPPLPPPRPPCTIPPPLPPKRIMPPAATPLIKLVSPSDVKHVNNEDFEVDESQSKSVPTLPIPIPLRKIHLEVASKSVTSASSASSFSSANGTSCSSSNPSCPPNSLSDGSFLSSLDAFPSNPSGFMPMSVESQSSSSAGRSPFCNGDTSPSLGLTASPCSNFSNSFTEGFVVRVSPKFSEVPITSTANLNQQTLNSHYVNQNNLFNNSALWGSSSPSNFIKSSIFQRESDPFADDFFESLGDSGNNCGSSTGRNNANQVRLGNPFTQNTVNSC